MKNMAIVLGVVILLALIAGCVQSGTTGSTSGVAGTGEQNQNTQVQSQTENITYENISNGTDLNDTSEVGT